MILQSSVFRWTISIHAPARGATLFCTAALSLFLYFNPRSREGSDALIAMTGVSPLLFQSTLPRGERRTLLGFSTTLQKFQSTLPRGERRCCSMSAKPDQHISIHAPARGATSILSKIHPMFLTISHNASSFSSFPFHSFLPHLLNSSTFCALFQVRISRAFSVYYRFAPKKSTPDL